MFHQFLPNPYVLTAPNLTDGNSYEIELVAALDVSNYKTGALVLRLHAGLADLEVTLKGYKIWPYDDALGVRFQDKETTPVTATAAAVGTGDNGKLLTTTSPATLCAPALRIVAELKASGGDITAGAVVSISAGIVLLAD